MKARFQSSRSLLALDASVLGLELLVPARAKEPFAKCGTAAVVTLRGPLLLRDEGGFDSYEAIRSRVAAALASSCSAVVLRIDSPGGEVAGCFELAREIRTKAKAAGKRVVAYVDGMAASAAYALACAADAIYAPPSAVLGSIGVLKVVAEVTGANRAAGLTVAIVASGARKADGNPHARISEGALLAMKIEVDAMAGLFFELVAEARALSPAAVAALDGGTFVGASAVRVGLADQVVTFDALLAMLATGDSTARVGAEDKRTEREKAMDALKGMGTRPVALKVAAKGATPEATERARLMASRPDFVPSVVAWLDAQPLATVRHAVQNIERHAFATSRAAPSGQTTYADTKARTTKEVTMATKTKQDAIEALMNLASDPEADPAERAQAEEALKILQRNGGDEGVKASAALARVEERKYIAQKAGVVPRGGVVNDGTRCRSHVMTSADARAELARRRGL